MKTLEALIQALQDDETVKSYQALEKAIENRPDLKAAYEDLLEKQKAMVRSEALKKDDVDEKRKAYEATLKNLENTPIIHQYLTLQADINEDMRTLFDIIESGVNEER
ncbi:MAG: YlbF family regulator [Bacillota bacterium]